MFRRTLTVSYSPLKNNHVLLPDTYYRVVSTYKDGCLTISHANLIGNHYMSWLPCCIGFRDDEIGMNSQVAQSIGLKAGDVVNCSMVMSVKSLRTVEVTAASDNDWELLDISSHRIQATLLDQTRIINKGQTLVVWLNDSICVKIKINFLMPAMPFGKLENDTEIVVAPYKRPSLQTINSDPDMSPLSRSSTNSSLAELVRQRKLSRTKTADLSEILQNGTPDYLKRRPTSLYKPDEPIKRTEIPPASPLMRHKSLKNTDSKKIHKPENGVDKFKKKEEPKTEDLDANLKKLNTIRNSIFENVLDNHINKLQTSKSVANVMFTKPAVKDVKYRNKNEYIDDLVATLSREVSPTFEFRVIPGKWNARSTVQICDIYTTGSNLFPNMDPQQLFLLTTNDAKEYYVNVKIICDPKRFPKNVYPTVEINDKLRSLLDINEFEKVTLQPKPSVLNVVDKIELLPSLKTMNKVQKKDIEDKFKEHILNNSKLYPVLLNQGQVFKLCNYYVTIKLEPNSMKHCLVNANILRDSKICCSDDYKVVENLLKIGNEEEEGQNGDENGEKKLIDIEKYEETVKECVERLKMKLCLDDRFACRKADNILIAAASNSGKKTVCNKIIKELQAAPYFCFSNTFHCSKHKGRKPESIQKELRHQFYLCMFHSPSVIFLDNLDILTHSAPDENRQDGEYHNKVSDIFRNTIEEFTSKNPISVVASVSNVNNLNKRIHSSRGHHIFHHIIRLPNLDKTDRESIIKNLCSSRKCKIDTKINWKKFTNLTEGYTIGNLVQFVDRAVFYAFKKNAHTPMLTDEMLNSSLDVTNSYCLQGIENTKKTTSADEDEDEIAGDKVPGLENAIEVFQEVLMWPTKYPKVFENSPLRNQAGILLFGPPGTGKTYLVSKLSKTWNLRMISVKGPELLAKYIGQSEENVRNLFDKARSAKPCVLFFDEFDSLAPRRGHDSTGVTDRVVNQLLTELDGVEGLHGVTVIGATSRPELLDPALLRSGRIDRLVECALPNAASRLAIFRNLSSSLHLDDCVDLKYFAEQSNYYTGADIQSILTSANMIAVQECLDRDHENVPDKIFITQHHLTEAFNNTRPSLSPIDIVKYKKTYMRFTNKETSTDFVAQRTTLA